MCYEFWESEMLRVEEEAAKQRARELIDKARSAMPVAPQAAPVAAETEKQAVPA
jgi:hypothetical protein